MSLKEKIFRIVTYAFFVFIVCIIIIQFGMPNFIEKAAGANRFLEARIGQEVINKRDVSQAMESIIRSQFKSQEVPAALRETLKSYVLNQLIEQKLVLEATKQAGFYPMGSASNQVVREYLNKNFFQYKTLQGFDYSRFEEEILKPNKISLSQIKKESLENYTLENFITLLDRVNLLSELEVRDQILADEIQVSLSFIDVDTATMRKILQKKITPEEVESRLKEKELRNKQDKETLTTLRESVINDIVKERLPSFEENLQKELTKDSGSMSFIYLAEKYGVNVQTWKNITVNSLHKEQEKQKYPIISKLFLETDFLISIFQAKPGTVLKPIKRENSFFVFKLENKSLPNWDMIIAPEKKEEMIQAIKTNQQIFLQNAITQKLYSEIPVKKYGETLNTGLQDK